MIRHEFERRIKEINLYFDFLMAIELDKPKLTSFNVLEDSENEINFDSERINIFRASAFLLLYNLVESTIYNSIISIFNEIQSKNLKYIDVTDEVKKYWLSNLYKHDERIKKDTVIKQYLEISNIIFNESIILISNYIAYGGSLDARNIRNTAKSLGIDIVGIAFNENLHGEALKEISQKRNWLAHGEKSFSEIGRDYDYNNLNNWKNYTIEHLEDFISFVEKFIFEEKYINQSTN